MQEKIAKTISIIFHPVLVPTLGLFLALNSGFYFSMLSWDAKKFVLLVTLFSTGILPMLTIAILAFNPKFDISMENSHDRKIPLLSSAIYYYLGYVLMAKMNAFPVFKIFLLASILVIVVLLLISFSWKISNHMAAVGGMSGTLFALSFRTGMNPVWILILVVLISGLVGTARLILQKHTLWQIVAGYILGFSTLYLLIYFV